MPIWLDLKQQHGRLTATTGSRHLLAARRPPAIFFPGGNGESETRRGSPSEGFEGFAFGNELLARNVESAAIGSGGLKKKQLVLPETTRRRSAVFGWRHLFSANNRLAGWEEEREALAPNLLRVRRSADFKKRLRSEGERIRKKRKEKKEKKKKHTADRASVISRSAGRQTPSCAALVA